MSSSNSTKIVIGVQASEFLEIECEEKKFELHDVKSGKATGRFQTDVNYYLVNKKTKDKILLVKDSYSKYGYKIYSESVAEILNLNSEPNEGEFGVKHVGSYYTATQLDHIIVGRFVKYLSPQSTDCGFDSLTFLKISSMFELAKEDLLKMGCDAKVKIFFDNYIG